MERLTELKPVYVKHITEILEDGILYISLEYGVAIHLCPCGCGNHVVTSLSKTTGWQFESTDDGKVVSLYPSIGNFYFKCKSHYFIKENKIVWL